MLKNRTEYAAFLFLGGLFRLLGITLSRKLALLLGSLFYYAVPIRKQVVIDNLRTAFPQKDEKEIKVLAKTAYRNFSLTFAELLMLSSFKEEDIKRVVDISGAEEVFKKYFGAGKPFFILTGHFGNWELFAVLPLLYHKTLYAMAKGMRNNYVSDWINKSREKFGVKVVLLGASIRELYKVLKDNGAVLSVGDQRGPKEGVRVNFFGKSTAAFSGTAALALKTNAPIIMAFNIRQKNLNYKTICTELKYDDLTGSDEEKIQAVCQRYFTHLESVIKEYPEQWFWMHKIWKY